MKGTLASLAFVALASAQRPTNTSICDYYSTALLKANNATTQQTLLTLIVNTAVIGNYTQPNVGIAVPGILTPGDYKGTKVNLLQYFDGELLSTNDGGSMGVSMNFLDGGGAAPLMMNMPANDTSSAQYMLLTHLYEYFAVLLGCSEYGSKVTPYAGDTNMYEVHKFMGLSNAEFGYFVQQVGLSAASFGAAMEDVSAVGTALTNAFGMRCAAPASIPPTATAAPQAICIQSDCPIATNAQCSLYEAVTEPATASPTASATATATGSAPVSSAPAPTMSSTPTTVPYSGANTFDIPMLSALSVATVGFLALWL